MMQIPKLIHYFYDDINIWEKGKNPQFRMCFYSWKKACPDYAIMLWHDKHPEFQKILEQSLFARKAYELKLWAFVADYVRLYALNKYGGIYLDTDVQLLQNFDQFLDDGFFTSIETDIRDHENIPEPAVMGSVPGHPVVTETMKFYQSPQIFAEKLPMIPVIMKTAIKNMTDFTRIPYSSASFALKAENFYLNKRRIDDFDLYLNQQCYRDEKHQISIYPCRYFCPSVCVFGDKAVTPQTVAIHWNQSSWWESDAYNRLRRSILPPPPPPPAPPAPPAPPVLRRESAIRLFKLPVLKIRRLPQQTKISCVGIIKVKIAPHRTALSLFGFITLFKIVRKN